MTLDSAAPEEKETLGEGEEERFDSVLDKLNEGEKESFDSVLDKLGGLGRYQKIWISVIPVVYIACACNTLSPIFLLVRPDFRCADGQNVTSYEALGNTSDQCFYSAQENSTLEPCTRWVYDQSVYKSTWITEWDLVCGFRWISTLSASLYLLLQGVGGTVSGQAADRFGRRPTLIMFALLSVSANIIVLLAPNAIVFVVGRTFIGAASEGMNVVGYILLMEMIPAPTRELVTVLYMFYWCAGYQIVALMAYLIRERFYLQLSYVIIGFVCLANLAVPESARWLLVKGRVEEGEAVLQKMADINKKELPEKIQVTFNKRGASTRDAVKFLFKSTILIRRTFLVGSLWAIIAIVYYALTLTSSSLAGNAFLNCSLSGLMEVFANILAYFLLTRFGRRRPLTLLALICGVALLAVVFIPDDLSMVQTASSMLGKFCVTTSFTIIYPYTAEIAPTPTRGLQFALAGLFGRLGSFLAPYIGELSLVYSKLPQAIIGSLSMASFLILLVLPETQRQKLPATIQEAEALESTNFVCQICVKKKPEVGEKSPELLT